MTAQTRPAGLTPARWRIRRFLANGYFEAHLDGQDADPGGPGYHNWVPAPEAVEDPLRQWSVPAGRPLEVAWDCTPRNPTWLWPVGGFIPEHRGNAHGLHHTASIDTTEAWEREETAHQARFAAIATHVRRYWPGGTSVGTYLAEAAVRLNAEHPSHPSATCWEACAAIAG
ncbi:hypothetical protein ACOZ38_29215 [Sphaerisporangium viridialbum]|uniref:hypothetical protein n=1 Tax=Sphaerisporangium viridialbum TaxID=46189 RepID=UPI003C791179